MCSYSVLGIILFTGIPFMISISLLVFLSFKIFRLKELKLIWKIVFFILSLVASWLLFAAIKFLIVMSDLDNLKFFTNMGIWKCPGLINGRPVL